MKVLGYFVSTVVVLCAGIVWSGYVLSILWGWFIVPTFQTSALGINAAIGVALVVSYLTHQTEYSKDERRYWERLLYVACTGTIRPAVALGVGYVVLALA